MSEEFKNEFDESKETETDNVNMQEETETVFEDNASKPGETTNESAVTQEPGNAPTPENPVYARAYQPNEQRESTKEEWYQESTAGTETAAKLLMLISLLLRNQRSQTDPERS